MHSKIPDFPTLLGFTLLIVGAWYIVAPTPLPTSYQSPSGATTTSSTQSASSTSDTVEMQSTSSPIIKTTSPEIKLAEIEPKPKSSIPTTTPLTKPTTTPKKIATAATETPTPSLSSDSINDKARAALVNIYCVAQPGLGLSSIIGSGVIIDPRGIVLTNAHIAEHLLLKDYKIPNAVTCYIRNGSPARTMYTADLIYIAPGWIEKNASNIASGDRRSGYGEEDYAFLLISETATETPLPQIFPYLPIEYREAAVDKGETLFSLGYPAELLPESNKVNSLYPITAFTTVETLITFTEDVLDVLYLGGNAVSQAGSSGGGVLTLSGYLIGIIATVSDGATAADRDFQAITLPYISRDLKTHAGYTLSDFLHKDPKILMDEFNVDAAPALTAKLIVEYEKRSF